MDHRTDIPTQPLQYGFNEAADALGIPLSTLQAECRAGRGPTFFKVGRRLYTTKRLIEEWQDRKIAEATNLVSAA